MAKGLCCFAQQQGDLGKPIIVTVHTKNGTHQRCGVCEVVPSCKHPQERVFAFRFLKAAVCGLIGKAACKPTAAGIRQYEAQVPIAAAGRELAGYVEEPGRGGPGHDIAFEPIRIPGGVPYSLPR